MTASARKRELRRAAALLPKAQAEDLLLRFARLPRVRDARAVMVFCGVGNEPDTAVLIRTLLSRGQRTALPVCLPGHRLEARVITCEDQLVPGKYGIPEPGADCPVISREELDAVLVPCLLADREGYRLGHGGGYYDRWLDGYGGFSAVVCPKQRLIDRLPREEFDRPVTLVLTQEGGSGGCSPAP